MIGAQGRVPVFAYRRPVDLRKGFEGLSALVQQALGRVHGHCDAQGQGLGGRGHPGGDGLLIRQVAPHGVHPPALHGQLGACRLQGLCTPGADGHVGASGSEVHRDGATDAAAAASHQNALVLEVKRHGKVSTE